MVNISPGAFKAAVTSFTGREASHGFSRMRERSWDICYTYFQQHPQPTRDLERSSLHLMAYLTSWGMFRGSTWIFKNTNVTHLNTAIEIIEKYNPQLRGWDIETYNDDERYQAYDTAWRELREALLPEGGRARVLLSKLMMGVWGCIPAVDTYFLATLEGLSKSREERLSWRKGNRDTLARYQSILNQHEVEIEEARDIYRIHSFDGAVQEDLRLPQAKVIDIFGFYTAWTKPSG